MRLFVTGGAGFIGSHYVRAVLAGPYPGFEDIGAADFALLEACGAGWGMVEYVEDRKCHDRRYSLDDSKVRAMGPAPRVQFERGLAETVQWYRDNRPWWEPLRERAALAR